MTCTEDQFRSILHAEAADITADSIPPLSFSDGHLTPLSGGKAPDSPGGRRQRWLVPLGAAAAVAAIAVVASTISTGGHTPKPNSAEPALWQGVPRDYFLLVYRSQSETPSASPTLVVRATSSGATLAVARPLQDCGFPQLSVAADDRTVVLACWHDSGLQQLFLARFDPASRRLALSAMRIPQLREMPTVALSPDGTKVAVAYSVQEGFGCPAGQETRCVPPPGYKPPPAHLTVRVYSVAGAVLRTWSGVGDTLSLEGLAWAPGGELAFGDRGSGGAAAIRLLSTGAPSGSLLRASRFAASLDPAAYNYKFVSGYAVSGDGATITTSFIRRPHANPSDLDASELAEFSLRTGQLLRSWMHAQNTIQQVIWSDYAGTTQVVFGATHRGGNQASVLGITKDGRFTPLPGAPGYTQGPLGVNSTLAAF
jgi:hypothetical protein